MNNLPSKFVILFFDALFLAAAFYISHLFRFDFNIPSAQYKMMMDVFPYIISVKIVIFALSGLYKGIPRYTSLYDLINIIKTSFVSALVLVALIYFFINVNGFPRSILIIDLCLTILFIPSFRLFIRISTTVFEENENISIRTIFSFLFKKESKKKNVIIIGTNDTAEILCRAIRDEKRTKYDVIGFLDDDPIRIGRRIHGIPVYGPIEKSIPELFVRKNSTIAILTTPYPKKIEIRSILDLCRKNNIDLMALPSLSEIKPERISSNSIRKISYADLLRNQSTEYDDYQIGNYIKNKVILVTGAGGFIGSQLCKNICQFEPTLLILIDKDENRLNSIFFETQKLFPKVKIEFSLIDTRNSTQIINIFKMYSPKVVFHAAIYKHIAMLESQPWSAIENNILGSQNLIEISNDYSVEKFVFLSNSNASFPSNILGATTRIIEMMIQKQNSKDRNKNRFVSVRFGNVVGSVGGVIPLFKKQIIDGGPVTVTHPEVMRHFITNSEICQLILQVGAMGDTGDLFVIDMGAPIKIDEMVRDLIKFYGLEPDKDIKIVYTGLRPGEKLYQELLEDERLIPTSHKKILSLGKTETSISSLNHKIDELKSFSEKQDTESIKIKLSEIVPGYIPEFLSSTKNISESLISVSDINTLVDSVNSANQLISSMRISDENFIEVFPHLQAVSRDLAITLDQNEDLYKVRVGYRNALNRINVLENKIKYLDNIAISRWSPIFEKWKLLISDELKGIESFIDYQNINVNPYQPLTPLQEKNCSLFKGRTDLKNQIINSIREKNRPTLALYGPRRIGKTSLLYQLPGLLPGNIIPIFIDLQRPIYTKDTQTFLYQVAKKISLDTEAYLLTKIKLPQIADFIQSPFRGFSDWLENEALPTLKDFDLLVNFDEFEKLIDALEKKALDLEIFDELRHLIQHNRKISFLFSGVRILENLGPNWASYFINIKPLEIGYLLPEEARSLITSPDSEFNIVYDKEVIEEILIMTKCHPYLVQLICSAIVEESNVENTTNINWEIFHNGVSRAIKQGEPYFTNIWKEFSGKNGQKILMDIAKSDKSKKIKLDNSTTKNDLSEMVRYKVLNKIDDKIYEIEIPMFKHWILNYAEID